MKFLNFQFLTAATILALLMALPYGPLSAQNNDLYQTWLESELKYNTMEQNRKKKAIVLNREVFDLEHFDLPLSWVETLPYHNKEEKRILESQFIHQKRNPQTGALESFIRWPIYPHDTLYGEKIAQKLKSAGLDARRKKYFKAQYTSSRSLLVHLNGVDGKKKISLKVSTNHTPGLWQDKILAEDEVLNTYAVNAYLRKHRKFKHFVPLHDIGHYFIKGLNQGMILRKLDYQHVVAPLYSLFHPDFPPNRQLDSSPDALEKGQYWRDHLLIPFAKANAELASIGLSYDSAHGQNFLAEFDSQWKPTGRFYLRDFGDLFLNRPILEKMGEKCLLDSTSESYKRETLEARLGIFHCQKLPEWIARDHISDWSKDYFQTFSRQLFSPLYGHQLPKRLQGSLDKVDLVRGIWTGYQDMHFPLEQKEVTLLAKRAMKKRKVTSPVQTQGLPGGWDKLKESEVVERSCLQAFRDNKKVKKIILMARGTRFIQKILGEKARVKDIRPFRCQGQLAQPLGKRPPRIMSFFQYTQQLSGSYESHFPPVTPKASQMRAFMMDVLMKSFFSPAHQKALKKLAQQSLEMSDQEINTVLDNQRSYKGFHYLVKFWRFFKEANPQQIETLLGLISCDFATEQREAVPEESGAAAPVAPSLVPSDWRFLDK